MPPFQLAFSIQGTDKKHMTSRTMLYLLHDWPSVFEALIYPGSSFETDLSTFFLHHSVVFQTVMGLSSQMI
jgi:hypothetical protein